MTLNRILCIQAAMILIVALLSSKSIKAQVGTIPACTNYTCRYGECEQLQKDFMCHCITNVKGINCNQLLQPGENLCLSSPCWNGGICNNLGNDWSCICPSGTSGKNCRIVNSAPCLTTNPCQNNAVCRVTNTNTNNNGFYCFCVGDWTGQYCETPIPLCSKPNPCYNGGKCINNACVCPRNFTGTYCQTFTPSTTDKKVVVLNKGAYVANLYLSYNLPQGTTVIPVTQTGSITVGQAYAFYIPYTIDYNGQVGCTLTVQAVAGNQVMSVKIRDDPECFVVWGTTLNTAWDHMGC